MLNVVRLTVGLYEENAYLGYFDGRTEAFLVDPGDKPDALIDEIAQRGLTLTHIFLTHGHFDHILAVPELVQKTAAKVWVHERDEAMLFDPYPLKLPPSVVARWAPLKLTVEQRVSGTELALQCESIRMIETPGHTPGGACFYFPDSKVMFTGDTLFRDGFGRTDFASSCAADLRKSLHTLFAMEADIRIYPGHGDSDTIGNVKRRFGL